MSFLHSISLMSILLPSILSIGYGQGTTIPSILNVTLVSFYPFNITLITNVTCQQCLCYNLNNTSLAINCFESNLTCQLFSSFPPTYRLQPTPQARLFFPQNIFPPPSQCCAPNWTQLVHKLNSATTISVNVTKPRCLAIDNKNNYLVTVEDAGSRLTRFHLNNLSLVDWESFPGSWFRSITYRDEAYFIGRNDDSVLVVDSNNLTVLNIINSPNIRGIRDIMFLQNGQVSVLLSPDSSNILFFNRSGSSGVNYAYAYNRSTSYLWPHGLWYVTDWLFYVIAWDRDAVYSYSTMDNRTWNETLVIDARLITNSTGNGGMGSHVTIDECGRYWLSIRNVGLLVYDELRQFLGNFIRMNDGTFDMLFTENYVMYILDTSGGRILRLDPGIICWRMTKEYSFRT